MTLKPCANRILIQFHFPPDKGIVLPNSSTSPSVESKRTKVEVLAVGPDVKVCAPGDFILMLADAERNLIVTSKEPAQGLIDASVVVAIVTDDYANGK